MAAEEKATSIDRQDDLAYQAEPLSLSDRRAIQALLSALSPLSDLRDRPIPLPFAVVFLSVALDEGQPVGKYAKDLNITRFATFKYLQSIGDRGRHNAPALGLVTIKRGYRQKTSVVLTDKGRAVAAQVIARLRRGPRRMS
jgi:DNA-binding MarR family transcriptional regulator